jgi:hypothetical protein
MGEYSPKALYTLYDAIHAAIPQAEMSGILGDSQHGYGYHRARAVLPSSDYSVHYSVDRTGDAWAASALDVKLPSGPGSLMTTVCKRLDAAMRARDPRVHNVREFGGTLNGSVTYAYDNAARYGSYGSWDDSHLWHVHLSIYRSRCTDYARFLDGIADVMAGVPMSRWQKAHAVVSGITHPWRPPSTVNLPRGEYYGPIDGPQQSHGGATPGERSYVAAIQRRLQHLGFAPAGAGWADGVWGPETTMAVTAWQKARKFNVVNGVITSAGWKALMQG